MVGSHLSLVLTERLRKETAYVSIEKETAYVNIEGPLFD